MILLVVIDDVGKQFEVGPSTAQSLSAVKTESIQGGGERSDVRSHRFAVGNYRGKRQIAQLSVSEV